MKKWMYLIFPTLLLGVFLFFYNQDLARVHEKERITAEKIAQEKAEAEAKKKAAEEQARVSAEKRSKEQADADAKVLADKEARYQANYKKLQDEITKNSTEADRFSKEAAALEIELDALHQKKEEVNKADFDLLKKVELERVAQQNADMEIQRKVEMISRLAAESALTAMPPPPPPPASAK
jgi:hypothetical protein